MSQDSSSEIEKQKRFNTNCMTLNGISKIDLGNSVITPADLVQDRTKWTGFAVFAGIGKDKLKESDENLLRMLFYEAVPLKIEGKSPEGSEIALKAEIKRFPYSINGNRDFQSFAVRLTPKSGEIERVSLNEEVTVAIKNLEVTSKRMIAETGNTLLRLEIGFKPTDEEQPPLIPPTGFEENQFYEHQ